MPVEDAARHTLGQIEVVGIDDEVLPHWLPPLRGQGKENAENLSEQSKTVNRTAEEWRTCGRMKHTDLIRRLEQMGSASGVSWERSKRRLHLKFRNELANSRNKRDGNLDEGMCPALTRRFVLRYGFLFALVFVVRKYSADTVFVPARWESL
jgi:hypothetical protein